MSYIPDQVIVESRRDLIQLFQRIFSQKFFKGSATGAGKVESGFHVVLFWTQNTEFIVDGNLVDFLVCRFQVFRFSGLAL